MGNKIVLLSNRNVGRMLYSVGTREYLKLLHCNFLLERYDIWGMNFQNEYSGSGWCMYVLCTYTNVCTYIHVGVPTFVYWKLIYTDGTTGTNFGKVIRMMAIIRWMLRKLEKHRKINVQFANYGLQSHDIWKCRKLFLTFRSDWLLPSSEWQIGAVRCF
jgi:hypothetical protein